MSLLDRECPQCGARMPVSSTALVCPTCVAQLANKLRQLPELLAELEWTIAHGTVTDEHRGPGAIVQPQSLEGPWCPTFDDQGRPRALCEHPSCWEAFESQDAAARWAAREKPLPHEGPLPIGVDAVETRDIALQTIRAWMATVSPGHGRHRARRRRGRPQSPSTPLPPAKDRPSRCLCCDLPLYSCHRRRSESTP